MVSFNIATTWGGVMITGVKSDTPLVDLVIPTEIDGKRVTKIEKSAFAHTGEYKNGVPVFDDDTILFNSITVPKGVAFTTKTFYNASVKTIYLPKDVLTIPCNCFEGSRVEKLVFEDMLSVTKVEDEAFKNCKYLKQFEWFPACKTIPAGCFYGSGLVSINGTENVTCIEPLAFSRCCIQEFTWPENCNTIPRQCFSVSELKKLDYANSDNVVAVIDEAFLSCPALEFFTWPSGCDSIPPGCFSSSGLFSIENISHVKSIGVEAFSYTNLRTIDWPAECNKIPDKCFLSSQVMKVKNISHVTSIGNLAFQDTGRMESFIWPANCPDVGYCCFSESNIKSIRFKKPENVKSIGSNAFAECKNLKTFDWPSGCDVIPTACFDRSGLQEITGISHVKEIYNEAFSLCRNLTVFHWPDNCHVVPKACFLRTPLEQIIGIENITAINEHAFQNTKLESLILPKSCKSVYYSALCSESLKRITVLSPDIELSSKSIDDSLEEFDLSACSSITFLIEKDEMSIKDVNNRLSQIPNFKISFDAEISTKYIGDVS